MELIKNLVLGPRPPATTPVSNFSPNTRNSLDYSLLLQFGPLGNPAAVVRPLFDLREPRFANEETDSGIDSLASPTPELDRNDLEEDMNHIESNSLPTTDSPASSF